MVGQAIGWFSSFALILTLLAQVRTQWEEQSSRGVSKWLYVGQIAAETGFLVYSVLLRDWVFMVTNAILFILNLIGFILLVRQRGWKNVFATA